MLQRLDYLVEPRRRRHLAVAIFPSPMRDFGYDVASHVDVDRIFGTLAEFDAVVDERTRSS